METRLEPSMVNTLPPKATFQAMLCVSGGAIAPALELTAMVLEPNRALMSRWRRAKSWSERSVSKRKERVPVVVFLTALSEKLGGGELQEMVSFFSLKGVPPPLDDTLYHKRDRN